MKGSKKGLISIYLFDLKTNLAVFDLVKERITSFIETEHEDIFNPINPRKKDIGLITIEKSGENDTFYEFAKNTLDKFNLDTFFEFEKRNALIYYFTMLDNYLFRCFRFILTKRSDIINKEKVSIEQLKEANGNINRIIQDKAEEKAMSKFDLDLFIDEIIEKKINHKFYKNYAEIFYYAKNKLGINHSLQKKFINSLIFFKQIRNLYVHGDGTINQIFLKRIEPQFKQQGKYRIGEKFQLTNNLIDGLSETMLFISEQFDSSMIKIYPELIYKSE